jgi:hypothetical protein
MDLCTRVAEPPRLDATDLLEVTKREKEQESLLCPVIVDPREADEPEVSWSKDGRPLDALTIADIRVRHANI